MLEEKNRTQHTQIITERRISSVFRHLHINVKIVQQKISSSIVLVCDVCMFHSRKVTKMDHVLASKNRKSCFCFHQKMRFNGKKI